MSQETSVSSFDLIKRLFFLQEERVQTYALFDEGYNSYIKGPSSLNFPIYRQLVNELTETFNNISQEIISIARSLETDFNLVEISQLIKNLQHKEEEKLKATVEYQLLNENPKREESTISEKEKFNERLSSLAANIREILDEIKFESEEILLQG